MSKLVRTREPLLAISGLGKVYRRYPSESLRFWRLLGFRVQPSEERWALREVSLEVYPGEAVGVVGQNGAGKSTLLKLVTGTAQASEGEIHIRGKVASILELGLGFSPEFTGRQNVRHSASLMGLMPEELDALMPSIEEFAEVGDYFDAPVQTYSSGMQVRVAFAVATARRPDLLIIDEALSVGDVYFQHKSFERIRKFQEQGTALLIVSHDRSAVQALCGRAVLLEKGRMLLDGPPAAVMDYYNAMLSERDTSSIKVLQRPDGNAETVSGTGQARVIEVRLLDERGCDVKTINTGQSVVLRIAVRVFAALPVLVFGYQIKDRLGQSVFGTNTYHTRQQLHDLRAGEEVVFSAHFQANLGPASYSISTALVSTHTHLVDNFEWRDLAFLFTVVNTVHPYFEGPAWLPPHIVIESKEPAENLRESMSEDS